MNFKESDLVVIIPPPGQRIVDNRPPTVVKVERTSDTLLRRDGVLLKKSLPVSDTIYPDKYYSGSR